MADAFFERITLFPMEGDPIPNEDCLSNIDKNQFPSLEQFGVICRFFGDVKLQLDDEGGADLARLSFEMKKSCEYTIKRSLKVFLYSTLQWESGRAVRFKMCDDIVFGSVVIDVLLNGSMIVFFSKRRERKRSSFFAASEDISAYLSIGRLSLSS